MKKHQTVQITRLRGNLREYVEAAAGGSRLIIEVGGRPSLPWWGWTTSSVSMGPATLTSEPRSPWPPLLGLIWQGTCDGHGPRTRTPWWSLTDGW